MVRTDGLNFTEAAEASKLTINGFNKAFVTLFFGYTGFETFITAGASVKNAKKICPKLLQSSYCYH